MSRKKDTAFPFFFSWRRSFALLSGDDCRALLLAMLDYAENETEPPPFTGAAEMAASFIFPALAINREIRAERSRAGRLGGLAGKSEQSEANESNVDLKEKEREEKERQVILPPSPLAGGARTRGKRAGRAEERESSFDTDDFFEAALRASYAKEDRRRAGGA